MKFTVNIGKMIAQFRAFKKPTLKIEGYTSRCEDGQHVLFLDYDMVAPEIVMVDIRALWERGYLTHAIVFSTFEEEDESGRYGNYHVICLDKMPFQDVYEAMRFTHSDSYHRELAKNTRFRSWVLRYTKKGSRAEPKFHTMLCYPDFGAVEQSEAHLRLLLHHHPEIREYVQACEWNLDESETTVATHYYTIHERSEAK